MIAGNRVVVVTPAGRERYLSVLARHILANSLVDEWQVWANTEDVSDLRYIRSLASNRVRVVEGDWKWEGNWSIRHYYAGCDRDDTVYVRIDDDVVWMERDAIEKLVESRLEDPRPFLVYGTVVNSPLNSHHHERAGLIPGRSGTCGHNWVDPVGWGDGRFAVDLHRAFLSAPDARRWYLHDRVLDYEDRMAVNVIAWTGADAKGWTKVVEGDEEAWLSCHMPKHLDRPNRIIGDSVFVHLAYFPQRETVDASKVLDQYRTLCP